MSHEASGRDRRGAESGQPNGAGLSAILKDRDFAFLRDLIYTSCGINITPPKRTMLEGRLRRRLRDLGLSSFSEYCKHLSDSQGLESESVALIDAVTTNKTEFFREPWHFDFLSNTVLPELAGRKGLGLDRPIALWSAGCSTGEEPYTLAMVLSEFAEVHPAFHFSILATDISTQVLEKARRGVYEHDRVEPVSVPMRKKYLLRSRDRAKSLVRIAPGLRSKVKFERLNLMDEEFCIPEPMAIIFCRNVIIYFDRPTQQKLLTRLCRCLMPGGFLFMGHSETLHGLALPMLEPLRSGTTIYRKLK